MTAPAIEKKIFIDFENEIFKEKVDLLVTPILHTSKKILRTFTIFNGVFLLLIFGEISYFFIHLAWMIQTFVMAVHLAFIFATIFCYFTIRIYAEEQKKQKLIALVSDFVLDCQKIIHETCEDLNSQILVAHACCKLASDLHGREYKIFTCPKWGQLLSSSFEKLNCWLFWQDTHFLKELLLKACIDEHIKFVRLEPTNLEAHAGLANAYVMLSGLYINPKSVEGLDDENWIPPNKYNEDFKQKFRTTAQKAVEEFKILSDYAPSDPWVHAQLAYSYHDLQMPQEEINEYETILRLCPNDQETLFKIGKLYFEQGQNAKGLEVYESLIRSQYRNAESLINYYGICKDK